MNELSNLIKAFDSRPKLDDQTERRFNSTLNSLFARSEQTIFDRLMINRELDPSGAKELLAKLHAGTDKYSRVTFADYLTKLRKIEDTSDFSFELTDLMEEVNRTENPTEALMFLVSEERAGGLVTEQDILPADFFPTRVEPLPDQMGPAIGRFRDEFVDQKPGLLERARGTAERAISKVKGFFGSKDPGYSKVPTTEMTQFDVATGEYVPAPAEDVGWPALGDSRAGFGSLRYNDFERIREYFTKERNFSDLSPQQAKLVESLRYTPEQFESEFGLMGDSAMYHEMRTQLQNELMSENVLSLAEIESFIGIDERFAVSAEEFSAHFGLTEGRAISMEHALHDINTKGRTGIFEELPEWKPSQDRIPNFPEAEDVYGDAEEDVIAPERETAWMLNDEEAALLDRIAGPQTEPMTPQEFKIVLDGMKEANGGALEVAAKIAYSSSGQILIEETFFEKFMNHQLKNLATAPVLMPLINWMTQGRTDYANYVNIGLGLYDVAMSGLSLGGFGLTLSVLNAVVGEINIKAQAKIENQHPDQFRGRNFGYIKVDGQWRPAVVKEIHKSTSFGARDGQLVMEYGDELIWVQMGDGTIKANFTHPDDETYDISTNDLTGFVSTKEYVTGTDITRDWYFLDNAQQTILMQTGFGLEENDFEFESYNIADGMNAYENSLEDIRSALALMQTFKNSPAVRATGASAAYYADYPNDRAFRAAGYNNDDWGKPSWYQFQTAHNNLYLNNLSSDDLWRDFNTSTNPGTDGYKFRWDTRDGVGFDYGINHFPENEYMLHEAWMGSLKALIQTQRLAAQNAEYNNYFPQSSDHVTTRQHHGQTANINTWQTPWSAQFTLPEHEYATAINASMLGGQIDSIDELDIPRVDRNFLTNKVINRYWINQITQRGGGDAFIEFLNYTGPINYFGGRRSDDLNSPGAWLTNDQSQFASDMVNFPDRSGDRNFGSRMPWQNSTDTGVLPEDMFYQHLTPENQQKNEQYQNFADEFQRRFELSKTSFENTGSLPDYTHMIYAGPDAIHVTKDKSGEADELGENVLHGTPEDIVDTSTQEIYVDGSWKVVDGSRELPGGDIVFVFQDGSNWKVPANEPLQFRNIDVHEDIVQWQGEQDHRLESAGPTYDDLAKHIDENLDIQFDTDGKPTAVVFEGEIFPMDLLAPELAGISQDTTPDTFQFGELEEPLQRLKQLLEETGTKDVTPEMLTPEGTPYVAWDADTRMPIIGNDPKLHDRLDLPDYVVTAMESNGVVHKMYNPFLHSIATEGIQHD